MSQLKPEVSVESIKQLVKKLKAKGFQSLEHHEIALCLVTIGFKQVCKQFGTQWNQKLEKESLEKLKNSEYQLQWIGKSNNPQYTPFLQLCSRGDIEKVKEFLLLYGKSNRQQLVNTTDNMKRTALHLAVKEGFDVLAEYLIGEGFSVKARDRQLKTPLHYCKNQLICHVLLKKGANVLARDNKYCTSAHYAAGGPEYKVLEMLLKKANVVNQKDSTHKTPIFHAIYNTSEQQINILRILYENGSKINQQDIHGKTPLHYAVQVCKSRCIPFLLQKGSTIDIRDNHGKTSMDYATNEKVKKILKSYCEGKGIILEGEQVDKRMEFTNISDERSKQNRDETSSKATNNQIYTKEVNQVATWVRQKFFVLMKKLQQSGVKSLWHLKRPYIYTGSWAEDIDSLEDLYQTFLNVSGPEAAMRAFNILCPYQKQLPSVIGKSQEAFQSFFGQNWFSNDPIQKVRNMHSQAKIRTELETKAKQCEDLKTQLLGYRSQIETHENMITKLRSQMSHYQKIEEQIRHQRTKNTKQYTQMLSYMNQIADLKSQIEQLSSGEQKTSILSQMVQEIRSKNEDLTQQIKMVKLNEAAARRKCGQLFLKAIAMAGKGEMNLQGQQNLYDDDAIINLYDLLKGNPPNLEKRFLNGDRRGTGKLNIQQFTRILEDLSMLPQDVMSMHRITGFSFGRKTLSMEEFKTILQTRHKNRPMWQKKLIRKIKSLILSQNITLQKFFGVIDIDCSGTIEPSQLRKGLQNFNIFMNQTDWSNLFNLLDADNSGTIQIEQLKNLLNQEKTGKLEGVKEQLLDKKSEKSQSVQEEEKEEQKKQEEKMQSEKEEEEEKEEKEEEKEPSQKSQNKLLSDEQQFKQQYEEEDEDEQKGIQKLNGDIKIQVPSLNLEQEHPDKIYLRMMIADEEYVKMADLTKKNLKIALKKEMIQYKIMSPSELKLIVTVFKTREFDEQNYMGELTLEIGEILQQENKWAINKSFNLEPGEFQKDVDGQIGLQVKWVPKQQD